MKIATEFAIVLGMRRVATAPQTQPMRTGQTNRPCHESMCLSVLIVAYATESSLLYTCKLNAILYSMVWYEVQQLNCWTLSCDNQAENIEIVCIFSKVIWFALTSLLHSNVLSMVSLMYTNERRERRGNPTRGGNYWNEQKYTRTIDSISHYLTSSF